MSFKDFNADTKKTVQSNLNQVIDIIQEDISGSATRRKYQTFVTGGVGPGVTSSLYQTIYDQDFTLQTANPVHQSLQSINQYSAGQIILNSDRVVLNSKDDGVIISGNKGVYITTPDWKTDFNELMDLLEVVVTELNEFMAGTKPAPTGGGPTGPTPSASALASALQKLKELKQ